MTRWTAHTPESAAALSAKNRLEHLPKVPGQVDYQARSTALGLVNQGAAQGVGSLSAARGVLRSDQVRKPQRDYVADLEFQIRAVGLQIPRGWREFRFHPVRKWRFDFAWSAEKLAGEIDGGVWTEGRHTRGAGFISDQTKLNEAVLLGWRVLRFVPADVESGAALALIEKALLK